MQEAMQTKKGIRTSRHRDFPGILWGDPSKTLPFKDGRWKQRVQRKGLESAYYILAKIHLQFFSSVLTVVDSSIVSNELVLCHFVLDTSHSVRLCKVSSNRTQSSEPGLCRSVWSMMREKESTSALRTWSWDLQKNDNAVFSFMSFSMGFLSFFLSQAQMHSLRSRNGQDCHYSTSQQTSPSFDQFFEPEFHRNNSTNRGMPTCF